MAERINILLMKDKYGNKYYGGDQDWYSSNSRAMAGCSSVAGANVLRSICKTNKICHDTICSSKKMPVQIKRALLSSNCLKDDFLILMTGVYETMRSFEIFPLNKIYDRSSRNNQFFKIVKPNSGRSSIGFIQGVLLFAKKIGLLLRYNAMPTAFQTKDHAMAFIKNGLLEAGSVVLLTSYNKHSINSFSPCKDESLSHLNQCSCGNSSIKCHFMTITGITDTDLIITTWGKIATISIDELVKSWQSIKAWESTLFYFSPAKSASDMFKSLLSSPLPFIKGIIQALTRKAAH